MTQLEIGSKSIVGKEQLGFTHQVLFPQVVPMYKNPSLLTSNRKQDKNFLRMFLV